MAAQDAAGRAAWVIGHVSVKDAAQWARYREAVPATLAPWGAELVCRAELREVLSGSHCHTDTVILKFSDLAAARAWHASPAYQALIPLRRAAAEVDLLLLEG